MERAAERTEPQLRHIPAIDGLRGLAVLLVVVYHLDAERLSGGFVGVDIFFVLSGFLITSLMLAEYARDERIDLVNFWARRARRLLPALFVLLLVVAALGFRLDPVERSTLRWDALTSLLYVQNWRFVATGQTYAAENSDPSLLGHLWSLSIEEQFYLLWPVLFVLLMGFAGRRNRLTSVIAVGLASAVSAALLAAGYDRFDPSAAYFSTHTRAFEPLAGALLAFVVAPRQFKGQRFKLPAIVSAGVALVSLATILVAATQLHFRSASYYQGGAVVVTVATCALVLDLTGGRGLATTLFSSSPLVGLGKVSYGLYLWHWPVIVWMNADRTGLSGIALLATQVIVFSALTFLSYRFVEQPIRAGQFSGAPAKTLVASLAAIVALAVAIPLLTTGAEQVPDYLAEDGGIRTVEAGTVPTQPTEGDVTAGEATEVEEEVEETVALGVIGDSVARSLAPGFEQEAVARGLNFAQATFGGCSVGQLLRLNADEVPFSNAQRCVDETAVAFDDLVANADPSVVVWYSQRERYAVEKDGEVLRTGTPEWRDAVFADWTSTLDRLSSRDAVIVLVLPAYGAGGSTTRCEGADPLAILSIDRCVADNGALQGGPLRAYYRLWAAEHSDRVIVIDATPVVCRGREICVTEEGELDYRPDDGIHFAEDGAADVAGLLLDLIDEELVERGMPALGT